MKTNVTMIRQMGEYEVSQRTKDGMFNATGLAKQWLDTAGKRKDVSDFLENKNTKEFIQALEDENHNTGIPVFTKARGKNGGTWMSPLLFIDFAMWLNPKFKVKVLQFVYDELIKVRHSAGDNYKTLSTSGQKLKGYNFSKVAKALNYIVFGEHKKDIRQSATQEQLKELSMHEENFSFAIDRGYIKTYPQLENELRKVWRDKNKNTPF